MCLKPSFWNICRDLKLSSTMPAVMSLFCSASRFDMTLTISEPSPRRWKRSSTCSDPNDPISILLEERKLKLLWFWWAVGKSHLKHHAISSSSSFVNAPMFMFISISLWMKYKDPLCLCGHKSLIFSPCSGISCFR